MPGVPAGRPLAGVNLPRPDLFREYQPGRGPAGVAAGVHGYVEKTASLAEFVSAIHHLGAAHSFLSTNVHQVLRRAEAAAARHPSLETLTAREKDILRLVGEGFASKQIAAMFSLSVRTVENHRASVMRKTGLHSAAQLAVHAVQLGLVEPAVALRPRVTAAAPAAPGR